MKLLVAAAAATMLAVILCGQALTPAAKTIIAGVAGIRVPASGARL